MTTLTEIAADIAANLAANMADVQQSWSQLDAVLDELRAAGAELEIDARRCYAIAHFDRFTNSSICIRATNHPAANTVRHIVEKHGGDWYITESGAVISELFGSPFVHFEGLDLTEEDTTP